MSDIKVQFDSGDSKVLFDGESKEVEIVSVAGECQWCEGEVPAFLDVTLSGFVECDCRSDDNTQSAIFYLDRGKVCPTDGSKVIKTLNATTFRIPHNAGCSYYARFDITVGRIEWFNYGCCFDPDTVVNYTAITFVVTLLETGIYVLIDLIAETSGSIRLFYGEISYAGEESCGVAAGIATNGHVNCSGVPNWPFTGLPCGNSGQVTVDGDLIAEDCCDDATTPDPMTFSSPPAEDDRGPFNCYNVMIATTAVGDVDYQFLCTTVPSWYSSCWQSSPYYEVLIGQCGQELCWKVRARNQDCHWKMTDWSSEVCTPPP